MIEPKVMDLLFVLASRPGEVFSREVLMQALWPDTTVGEDALSRCVFKLRKSLDSTPGLIETIPKRGYRLVTDATGRIETPARGGRIVRMTVVAGAIVILLAAGAAALMQRRAPSPPAADPTLARADDSYFQYTWADNEAAIVLYERTLDADPNRPEALAGLSSALIQRRMRWPHGARSPRIEGSALKTALASGYFTAEPAAADLRRALEMARRAGLARPSDAAVQRALGLALSASGHLTEAARVYDRALAAHPDDWGLLINRADVHDLSGQPDAGLPLLERAYAAMTRDYARAPAKVRPWQGALGVEIGRRHEARGDAEGAARWYRRTLADDPSAAGAADRLAALSRAATN